MTVTLAACGGSATARVKDIHRSVSPDGASVAFVREWEENGLPVSDIFVARRGGRARRMTQLAAYADSVELPRWSPDGSKIAFVHIRAAGSEYKTTVYVMNANGTGLRKVSAGGNPSWRNDSRTIAFDDTQLVHVGWEPDREFVISTVAIDEIGTPEPLIRGGSEPAWSPDGSKVAFVRGHGEALAIFDVRTKTTRSIFRSTRGWLSHPSWSADGRLVFQDIPADMEPRAGYWTVLDHDEIYVVDDDGSDLARLTDNQLYDGGASWTPDGRILFFNEKSDGPLVTNADGSDVHELKAWWTADLG